MASPSWEVRLSRHAHDLDASGHDTAGVATPFAEVQVTLESNTNTAEGALVAWDTMYDDTGSPIGSLPGGLGMSIDGTNKTLTADEEGTWLVEAVIYPNADATAIVTAKLANSAQAYTNGVLGSAPTDSTASEAIYLATRIKVTVAQAPLAVTSVHVQSKNATGGGFNPAGYATMLITRVA